MEYNEAIYSFIKKLFLESGLSKRKFAKDHYIEDSTLRDILSKEDYQISLVTIYRICEGENLNPADFFKKVEQMFPQAKPFK
ncbi:transcriptional regulator [Leeuwenhoekiella marinoflava]|uniref:transcriptional regulator n=1 Tax=Leeuwenhoekiella marinoflava TaxID=988 RepID=UPI003001B082